MNRALVALLTASLASVLGACNLFTESELAIDEPPDTGDVVTGDTGVGDGPGEDEDETRDETPGDENADETTDETADVETVEPGANACGGSAALRYRGTVRAVGERCGCTGTIVCAGPDALQCANDGGNNACGGCGALPGTPGGACGACGGGRWVCGDGALTCEGALERNLCGGCADLAGAPGAPCEGPVGSRWECSGDAVVCALPDRNLCGAFGDLTFDGLDATPGEACEAGCGAGRLICDPTTQALFCDGPEPNACGGCSPLPGALGAACGCGDGGRWVCDGTTATCEGGDTNACGGCGSLAVQPGAACAGGALRICVSRDATACATFGGGSNFCGGEVALTNLPGGACGSCETGTYACTGPDEVGCAGDRGAGAFNACGGCGPLVGSAGDSCGTCGLGELRCNGADAFMCDGDPGATALNACGGCAALANAPGTPCGTCAAWRCVGGGVQCLADPGAEGCGGTRVTCADLASTCLDDNRRCTEATTAADATCGACLDGFEDRAGRCEAIPADVLPEVMAIAVDAGKVTATTAPLQAELLSLGTPGPTQHGFCRGLAADPAIGGSGVVCSELGTATAIGVFEETVSGLTPDKTYHARAYATNRAGTAYASDVVFTTRREPPEAPTGVSATTDRDDAVRVTWSPVAGATGYLVRVVGGAEVDASSPYDDTSAAPGSITGCTPTATTDTFAGRVALACAGASVSDGAERQYEVIAIGPGGPSAASAAVTGRRSGGALAYAWERSAGETAAGFAAWAGAPAAASGDDTTVPFHVTRHYRVELTAGEGVAPVTTTSASGRRGLPPAVESLAATDVTTSAAQLNGAVTSLGGATSAAAAGFCWRVDDESSACAGPSATQRCASGWTDIAAASTVSPFSAAVTLLPGTSYAACAYAANDAGLGHGTVVRFAAGVPAPATPTSVSATTTRANDVRVSWSAVASATSYEVEIDGSDTWIAVPSGTTYTDTTAAAPTLSPCTASASDGTSGTEVVLACTGDSASPGTARSYRVRALGAGGTSGASASVPGNRAAGVRAYQWQRSSGDSEGGFGNVGSAAASAATTDPMSGITAPAGRFYRAEVSAAGAASVTSNADRGYIAAAPTVTTSVVAAGTVTANSARFDGEVSALNAASVTEHGFCRGPSANPAIGGSGVVCSTLGARATSGTFSDVSTGLRGWP